MLGARTAHAGPNRGELQVRTSSLKTVPAKMRVLWQNSREEAIADEEVEVHGGADRFCPVGKTSPRVTAMSQILRKPS